MKPRNPYVPAARRRKAGAHSGKRRPEDRRYVAWVCLSDDPHTLRECDLCGAMWLTNAIGDECPACSGEEGR